jgi:hypothetical protein
MGGILRTAITPERQYGKKENPVSCNWDLDGM